MYSEGKLVSGPMIIEKANYFYDEIKITGNCIFSEGCNKKLCVRTYVTTGTACLSGIFENATPGCQVCMSHENLPLT
jgi:hypothetical protein